MANKQREIKISVEMSPDFSKRYTRAVMAAYQQKANREKRTIGGVFFPQKGSRGEQ